MEQSMDRRVVPRCSVRSPKVTDLEDVEGQGRKTMKWAKGWITELIGEPDLLRRMVNGHGRPQFQQRFFGQASSNDPTSKFNKDRVSNLNEVVVMDLLFDNKCLAGKDGCFNCGKNGHKIRNCSLLATKGRDGR
uniref:CCHC-type domain-containing protein n=1 Tax=Solanum tuberosum TaxID=4113 RepID=M1DJA5_SOLTU